MIKTNPNLIFYRSNVICSMFYDLRGMGSIKNCIHNVGSCVIVEGALFFEYDDLVSSKSFWVSKFILCLSSKPIQEVVTLSVFIFACVFYEADFKLDYVWACFAFRCRLFYVPNIYG
jgi:uncharacterized protein (DUF486 family)